jgi:signal transduction histidine kinase
VQTTVGWCHRRKDGTVIDVEVHSHAIVFDGRPARVVMATDITRRRRAEEELRLAYQAERQAAARLRALDDMKNMFLNAVSHELRTPLASVLGSSLTLERLGPQLTEKERADLLRAVTSNARKLERMLSDLLDLDRLTRGVTRPRLEAVELGELVASVVAEPEFQVGRRIEVETHPMVFKVDRSKVQRIVENLLANAIRHTPPGTPIWVRVRRVSEGARIEVDDAGSGIAPEIRGTIFEPFAQGPDRRDHAPGVGIGLSLVKRFAELHRGTAWVEDRPGGGAAFRVLLREPTAPGPDE